MIKPTEPMEYDPTWLIQLARVDVPDRPEIITALEHCTQPIATRQGYVQFVSAERPNQPGSAWQFRENIALEAPEGTVVLDVLKDGRIGGVEFVWLIP
jgi:hypothetical protein